MENVRLMLVGEGPRKRSLQRVLKNTNTIFTGQIPYDKMPDYYAAADVIVTASESETQGLFVWEAHAAGKPVVGIDAVGVRDYITHNKNGLLYKYEEDDEIGIKVGIDLLSSDKDLLAKLSNGAREITERRRGYDSTKKHAEIYKSLVKLKIAV